MTAVLPPREAPRVNGLTKAVVGILISLGGLYLGFRKFDGPTFLLSLRQTDLRIFGLSMLVMVMMVILRAWRWRYLLAPLQAVSTYRLFTMEMIGFFGNNVFPMRMGEILRAYALSQKVGLSGAAVLGTIVVERLFDSVVFVIILAGTALIAPRMPDWVRLSAVLATLTIFIFGILLYISQLKREKWKNYLNHKLHMQTNHRIGKLVHNLWQGLSTLRRTPHRSILVLLSFLIWGVCIFNTWLSGAALGINFRMPELLLLFFVTSAVISVPAAPGYVGTYHAATIGILVYLGYALSTAQALAVILHAVGYISLTLIGLCYFLLNQFSFRETSRLYLQKGAL